VRLKDIAFTSLLLVLLSEAAIAQDRKPLFLDARPGEDPSVIDITEVTGFYDKRGAKRKSGSGTKASGSRHTNRARLLQRA
jgi:hypothetical protein